jgi:hypothetical protein
MKLVHIKALSAIAEKYGLGFIDRTDLTSHVRDRSVTDTVVFHSYGIRRKQSFEGIVSHFLGTGLGAHIYISTGRFNYLAVLADPDKQMPHVSQHNTHCIGIEVNEGEGNIITDYDVQIFNEIADYLDLYYARKLDRLNHRDLTGKNCPFGYSYQDGILVKL